MSHIFFMPLLHDDVGLSAPPLALYSVQDIDQMGNRPSRRNCHLSLRRGYRDAFPDSLSFLLINKTAAPCLLALWFRQRFGKIPLKKSSRQLVYKPPTAFQLFSILESLQFATLNQLCNELLGSLVIDVVSLIYDFIQIVGHNLC